MRKQSHISAVVVAGFLIPLVSAEALNTDYCWRQDIERGVVVYVLLRASASKELNELPYYKTSVLVLVIK